MLGLQHIFSRMLRPGVDNTATLVTHFHRNTTLQLSFTGDLHPIHLYREQPAFSQYTPPRQTNSFSAPRCLIVSRSLVVSRPFPLSYGDEKHLPWRTRLAVATCYAFEDAGNPSAAANCAAHALEKVHNFLQIVNVFAGNFLANSSLATTFLEYDKSMAI